MTTKTTTQKPCAVKWCVALCATEKDTHCSVHKLMPRYKPSNLSKMILKTHE